MLLHTVLSSEPSKLYTVVSRAQKLSNPTIHFLKVGTNTYTGDAVPDGFYRGCKSLKVPDSSTFTSNPNFCTASSNFHHIIQICQAGPPIPTITESESKKLLERLRPEFKDLYSISACHYISAGTAGIYQFCVLFNILIHDINLSAISEVN